MLKIVSFLLQPCAAHSSSLPREGLFLFAVNITCADCWTEEKQTPHKVDSKVSTTNALNQVSDEFVFLQFINKIRFGRLASSGLLPFAVVIALPNPCISYCFRRFP